METRESNGNTTHSAGNAASELETPNKIFYSNQTNNFINSDIEGRSYEHLIQEQNLPTMGLYYICKEHPDIWNKDPRGLIESHFKPIHAKSIDMRRHAAG